MSKKPKKSSRPKRREIPTFDSVLQNHRDGKLQAALTGYRTLLKHDPKNAGLHHLLGRLMHQLGDHQQAIQSLVMSLELAPSNSQCLNDLGLVYLNAEKCEEAIDCLTKALEIEPANSLAASNLGVALKNLERTEEAKAAFQNAIELDPDNLDAICNLGHLLKRLGENSEAETLYRRGLELDPGNLEIYPSLISVMRRQEKLMEADAVFDQWLAHDPENPVAIHLKAASASGSDDSEAAIPDRASQGYVREMFDDFAETFDQHLSELDYRGPKLIEQAISKIDFPEHGLKILDAGCGTGLVGPILKPFAKCLVGVDLSSKMLEKAEQMKIYDELVTSDLVDFLQSNPLAFELVVVADTFGYFGDLSVALKAVKDSLCDDGQLICTIELDRQNPLAPHPGFRLMRSGRYRHQREYVESAFAESGLNITKIDEVILRMEAEVEQSALMVVATINQ